MEWQIRFHPDFQAEFDALSDEVQDRLLQAAIVLRALGPGLGRPHVDTLAGSTYKNMKELRFDAADGVWRVAFAFDAVRHAILLVAGDKSGISQKRFYKTLIAKADQRFAEHLRSLN